MMFDLMNDLVKNRLKRFFAGFGLRIMKVPFYRYEYDRENFLDVTKYPTPVIFDVGANIGQSAVWFSKSFPSARIYAFEPIPTVFKRLEKEVAGVSNIKTLNLACGDASKTIQIPSTDSDTIQTIQVLAPNAGTEGGDEITVTTVDDYCESNNIPSIQILKTDTEGYDLDVLRGASRMLGAGGISYILSEVSIIEGDELHTNLFEITEWLRPFGFKPVSFYDLHHDAGNGKLTYFNALFQKNG
jgi:FkbM family methyltransferase